MLEYNSDTLSRNALQYRHPYRPDCNAETLYNAGSELAGKALISPDQLRAQLKGLSEQRILAVLMVDLLDCSGSFLTRVRDLVGRNPVFLIGTKVGLVTVACVRCCIGIGRFDLSDGSKSVFCRWNTGFCLCMCMKQYFVMVPSGL